MKVTEADVVITGAGPAGSTAAIYCRRQGLKVALIDKEVFPRDKTCGDALLLPAVEVLQELDLLEKLGAKPHFSTKWCRFYGEQGRSVDLEVPYAVYAVQRSRFDEFLFREAQRLGATTFEKTRVTDVLLENEQVRGVRALDENEQEHEFRAPVTLACDGANGVIARRLDHVHGRPLWIYATRCYFKGVDFAQEPQAFEFYFFNKCAPGYFWIWPVGNGIANTGLGYPFEWIRKKGVNIKQMHEDLLKHPAVAPRFAHAERIEQIYGAPIPVAETGRQLVGDGYMLLGDAAQMVNPLWGDGIHIAMSMGKLAAQSIGKAKGHNGCIPRASLQGYQDEVWAHIGEKLKLDLMWRQKLEALAGLYPFVDPFDYIERYIDYVKGNLLS